MCIMGYKAVGFEEKLTTPTRPKTSYDTYRVHDPQRTAPIDFAHAFGKLLVATKIRVGGPRARASQGCKCQDECTRCMARKCVSHGKTGRRLHEDT